MLRASIIRRKRDVIVRLPREIDLPGVTEFIIEKRGDAILLRPVRPTWTSLIDEPRADDDFLCRRTDVIEDRRLSPSDDEEAPL